MSFSFGFVFTVNCKFVQILLIRISLGFLKRILHSSKWPWHLYHICRHLTSGGSPVWIAKSFLKNRSLFAFIIIRMLVWSQDLGCLPSHHEKSMGMKRDWISWFHEERCSQDQLKPWFILVWMIKNFVCEKYYHFLYKIDNNRNKLQPLHWMKHRLTIFFLFYFMFAWSVPELEGISEVLGLYAANICSDDSKHIVPICSISRLQISVFHFNFITFECEYSQY